MTRTEFTLALAKLILKIEHDRKIGIHKYKVALDYAKRSPEEQKRLFDVGLSKCDGINKISGHQIGKAGDLLFFTEGGVYLKEWPDDLKRYMKTIHDEYWEKILGGKNDIEWDQGHFEG